MSQLSLCVVFLACICHFDSTWARPPNIGLWAGPPLGRPWIWAGPPGGRIRRNGYCRDPLKYPHGSICCLKCPAGTHLKSHCTRHGQKGQCEECDYGSFTEQPNRLEQCIKCTQCRSDQEVVSPCTHTQDAECQCKSGSFCAHDQACEVCKKCTSCEEDEVVVRKCTSTTNTQCKKAQPSPAMALAQVHH